MLAITVMLLNKDRISAKELADKFEVSVRTIYRDIDAINLAGIPIISYQGNNGGFGILPNYKIDRQLLTLKDIQSILSALKGVNLAFDNRELDTAIEKIHNLVPKEKTDELNLHLEQIVIDILPWGFTQKQKELIKIIHAAIAESKLLSFKYRNYNNEFISRTVEPMTLIFKGYAWYLFGFCLVRNDYRLFRLSRIKGIKTLDQIFIRRNKSYRELSENGENKPPLINLVLRFNDNARVRLEDYFDEEHLEYEKDDSIIVRASWPFEEWIYSYILGFGSDVEVLEPAHIRKTIKDKAEKILQFYKEK